MTPFQKNQHSNAVQSQFTKKPCREDRMMVMMYIRHIRCACTRIGLAWALMSMFGTNVAFAAEGNTNIVPGIGLLRGIGIASALGGIIVLILVHFIYRNRLSRGTYHWLLLLGLFVLPITATLSTTATASNTTTASRTIAIKFTHGF